MFRLKLFFLILVMLLHLYSCTSDSAQKEVEYKVIPEIKEVMPDKAVKIKLKRDKKGEYLWELNGDNVDRIIEIDKKLREYIKE